MISVIVRALDSDTKRKLMGVGIASALLAVSFVATIGFLGGAFWNPQTSHPNEPIFTIDHIVAGGFADFVPYEESFNLNTPTYTVYQGLSNIVNLEINIFLLC